MTATVLHGIANCDTVRKARTWLESHGVAHRFRDYKREPPTPDELAVWCGALGWEALLNRAGTTFRKLPEQEKADLDEARAIALMLAAPSMIKRPLLEQGGRRLLGFTPQAYAGLMGQRRA